MLIIDLAPPISIPFFVLEELNIFKGGLLKSRDKRITTFFLYS